MEIKQKPSLHASWIDPDAKEIVRLLQRDGFTTYLVGGCVRDLLVGLHPKDFDIATSAEPNQVKRKIRGAYVIGRRFRLVLVKRGQLQFEVATFRRAMSEEDIEAQAAAEENEAPTVTGDNYFGTPEQDALRRDFTINALFYDPIKNELIDFAKGLPDIEARVLRMIGDPLTRIKEDPIRSLRAVRFAHKIGFSIDNDLRNAIYEARADLKKSVLPRRREEYLKLLRLKDLVPAWFELYDLGLLEEVLPSLMPIFSDHQRTEVFRSYLHRISEVGLDPSSPANLYLPFMVAVFEALDGHPQKNSLIDKLMRDELMMFKAEQAQVLGAIELQESLRNIESYRRKGHRRQRAFLGHESFQMALRLAEFDYQLPMSVIDFWKREQSKDREFSANN